MKKLITPKKVFYTLICIFVLLVLYFFIPIPHSEKRFLFPVVTVLGFVFFILGIILIFVTIKSKIKGKHRIFLILTGSASSAALVFVVLHNLVYGLFIVIFGEDFWTRTGIQDEPVFFILALIVCPLVFIVSAIGSLVMFLKKR